MSSFTNLTVDALVSKPISAIMQPLRRSCVPVFMLHRIEDNQRNIKGHSLALLEQMLTFLKAQGYQGISVKELFLASLNGTPVPANAIAFTMDDGFKDQAELGLPLFESFQMPLTFFIATDFLDSNHWSWDQQLEYVLNTTTQQQLSMPMSGTHRHFDLGSTKSKSKARRQLLIDLKALNIETALAYLEQIASVLEVDIPEAPPAQYQPMTWQDAKKHESEFIHFGPHSCSHTVLSQLSDERSKHEICHSWQRLQAEVKNPCPVFCYPSGHLDVHFGEREMDIVSNTDMIGALAADPGYAHLNRKDERFYVRRFSLPDSLCHFKQYCSWIERAKELTLHRLN